MHLLTPTLFHEIEGKLVHIVKVYPNGDMLTEYKGSYFLESKEKGTARVKSVTSLDKELKNVKINPKKSRKKKS